jgi:hypothetical protein
VSPNAEGGGELRGLSQWVQLYKGAQISFGDITPNLTNTSGSSGNDVTFLINLKKTRGTLSKIEVGWWGNPTRLIRTALYEYNVVPVKTGIDFLVPLWCSILIKSHFKNDLQVFSLYSTLLESKENKTKNISIVDDVYGAEVTALTVRLITLYRRPKKFHIFVQWTRRSSNFPIYN